MTVQSLKNGQWHLYTNNSSGFTANVDLNIAGVWGEYTGAGVHVGVVDDGIQFAHSDLAGKEYVLAGVDVDGAPLTDNDGHGTAVAGLIAASADGGTNQVGIASDATLSSIRIFGTSTDRMSIREAFDAGVEVDVLNNSWGFTAAFYRSTTLFGSYWDRINTELDQLAENGRDGLGTIVVKSAGNSRRDDLFTAMDGANMHHGVINVAAADYTGSISSYSTPGASVLVTAPSSGAGRGVTTTDLNGSAGYSSGNVTSLFGGTSAAAPMVSGVAALLLEANPWLTYADVQDIFAYSARHIGSAVGAAPQRYEKDAWFVNNAESWNGGGLHFSTDYGFGLVDATAAVRLAEVWSMVSDGTQTSFIAGGGTQAVGAGTPVVRFEFNVAPGLEVDSAELSITGSYNFSHFESITLISPDGTRVEVLRGTDSSANGGSQTQTHTWDFLAQAFRGEDSAGVWVADITFKAPATFSGVITASLELHGTTDAGDDHYVFTDEFADFWTAARGQLEDLSGSDTLNFAAVTSALVVDLTPGAVTSIDGKALTLGRTTLIEQAITGVGDDTIIGNEAGNVFYGGAGDDTLFGHGGDDVFRFSSGEDRLDGGAGIDSFLAVGHLRASADISVNQGDGYATISLAGSSATLEGVEQLVFQDGTYVLDTTGSSAAVARLYQAAFDRVPDVEGLVHNIDHFNNGLSLKALGEAFLMSAEFRGRFGESMDSTSYVTKLYNNVLGRDPDAAGLAGWTGMLARGETDRGQVLIGFSESTENIIGTADIIDSLIIS